LLLLLLLLLLLMLLCRRRLRFCGVPSGPAGAAGGEDRKNDPDRCPHGSRR